MEVGGFWRLVVFGGWWFLEVGGFWRLVVFGGWWFLEVGGFWRLVVFGGWWFLEVGGFWRLVVCGGWCVFQLGIWEGKGYLSGVFEGLGGRVGEEEVSMEGWMIKGFVEREVGE